MSRSHRRRLACFVTALGLAAALGLVAAPAGALTEDEVLARFEHEPTVQQVQDAAIRYYFVHPDSIRAMRRNAMLKALVPTVGGEFTNSLSNVNRELNDGLYQSLPFKESESVTGDALGWRVQVSWVLDRLMFNPEVLDVQSLIGILDGVVREVTTIYYIRRRLQIDTILRPPPDLGARISQRIRIEELTGLIDAMTGSYMTKALERAHERRGGGRRPPRRDRGGEGVFNSGDGQWPNGK